MIYKRKNSWHMDVTINGVRYREALHTADRREALALEKKRIGEIQQGKGASKSARDFARKPFSEAAELYLEERTPHVSERTTQLETERLKPLKAYFGDKPVLRFKAEDIASYQKQRVAAGISNRTVNMEVGVLRRIMKRAKVWTVVAEDVRFFPERTGGIGRVLDAEEKQLLFQTAASRPDWLVAHCAAVLSVSTTGRGVEIKNLRWTDVDLFSGLVRIGRSKTAAGLRTIPLNGDASAAIARLWERAQGLGSSAPDHYVFPACECGKIDPSKPQKSFRTAWRSLVEEAAKRAGDKAAGVAVETGTDPEKARLGARSPFVRDGWRLRFHDLRHQAITEMAEKGASDQTLMALAGHMSRKMLEHYSHVRMAAKRDITSKLESGLMGPKQATLTEESKSIN